MRKVLIVVSGNAANKSPFVLEQVNALKKLNIKFDYFQIKGKGIIGYIRNYKKLLQVIKLFEPDIVHAHYGLSGLLAVFQRKVPVVTTFHGSDINIPKNKLLSKISDVLSARSIFVSKKLAHKLHKKNPNIIACGIDLDVFYPIDKNEARKKLGLPLNKKLLLFSSSFNNTVKNYPLAREAVAKIANEDIELIELKGYKRFEVALLMNAVDAVLLTSFTEGSPQFVKEAMACNTPIISTNVGDVADIIKDTDGCFLSASNSDDVAAKIKLAFLNNIKTNGRSNISHFDNTIIANRIVKIYNSILNDNN